MLTPKISIILPAYNASRYVGQAIRSVLDQTLSDWELLVVDDGSTDDTGAVLATFTDPRIRVIPQENKGEAGARNTGLDSAQGTYLAFLDADDLYQPEAMRVLAGSLDGHPDIDAVYADGHFCNETGRLLMPFSEHRPGVYTGNILEQVVVSSSVILAVNCIMVRRSIVERFNIRFDPGLVIGPDWDFWIQLARYARFGYLDEPVCLYRVHTSNISHAVGSRRRKDDLVKGRLKVMNSEWFGALSLPTQQAFFYNLLVTLLSGQPKGQETILLAQPFVTLPAAPRSWLLRMVATDYLLQRRESEFTRRCLEEALAARPADRQTRGLLVLFENSYRLCVAAVAGWHAILTTCARVHRLGQKHSRPVPAALRM